MPEITVDFDDGDRIISEEEREIIRDKCKNDNYKVNLFIVNNLDTSHPGETLQTQPYSFIYPGSHSNMLYVAAHEIGHSALKLPDIKPDWSNDKDNLMWWNALGGTRLRFDQWEKIHE